jgi:hypothetical protein
MSDTIRTAGQAQTFPYTIRGAQNQLLTPASAPLQSIHATSADAATGANPLSGPTALTGSGGSYFCTYPPTLAAGTYFVRTVSSLLTDIDDRLILIPASGSLDAAALLSTAELEAALTLTTGTLNPLTASLASAGATAVIEATIKQTLMQVTETIDMMGTPEAYLTLPARPVTAVASAAIDGSAVVFKRLGSRLWRAAGWQVLSALDLRSISQAQITGRFVRAPSLVTVSYTHGYVTGDRMLELARKVAVMLAGAAVSNPTSDGQVKIDDYEAGQNVMLATMDLPDSMKTALRRQYGAGPGTVRPQ